KLLRVVFAQLVRDTAAAASPCSPCADHPHSAHRRTIRHVHADYGDLVVTGNSLLEVGAPPRKPVGTECERSKGRLEEQATVVPLVHVPALHHALPAADFLVEARSSPARGMYAEVAPDLTG